jgi:hypothetical protein
MNTAFFKQFLFLNIKVILKIINKDMKIDFINVVDTIFKNRQNYKEITDKDKETFFFIINRKFGVEKIKQSQFFNNKFIDKASAMDIWHLSFGGFRSAPGWYWKKSKNVKEKSNKITGPDRKLMMENTKLTEADIDFMIENYLDDLQYEIKKLKRFEK